MGQHGLREISTTQESRVLLFSGTTLKAIYYYIVWSIPQTEVGPPLRRLW